MLIILKAVLGSVFDGAGRWVLAAAGAAVLLGGFWVRDNKVATAARLAERAAVTAEVQGATDATKARLRGAAARSADRGVRGVLDPTTRW